MEALKREALAFAQTLQDLYWVKRDIPKLLALMDPEVTWLGQGGTSPNHGCAAAEAALQAELRESPVPFLVTESSLVPTPLSDSMCLLAGQVSARPAEGADVAGLRRRVTMVCARREGGMRLLHLHLSSPDRDQVPGEHDVREQEELMSHIPGGMCQCRADAGLTLLRVSSSFLRLCGYDRETLRTRFHGQLMELISPQDRPHVLRQLARHEAGAELELEYRIQRGDGQTVWLLSLGSVQPGPDGQDVIYSVALDVTRRKHIEEDLRLSLERHRIIMEQTSDVIFEWDIRSDTLRCSSNWEKSFGYLPLQGHLRQYIETTDNIHPDDRAALLAAMDMLTSGAPYAEMELRLRSKLDDYLWRRIRATAQTDAAEVPIKVVGIITDIDADKRHQQQLIEQASRDALTGLLNRSTLQSRVEAHLAESAGPHALMIMDLDAFKAINDSFGHMCGDAILSDAAAALRRVFRRGDVLGRIGGDEFLIFLPNVGSRETVARKAAELLTAISGISVDATTRLSCSVGVAMAPADASDYARLYQLADQVLYQVKKRGKGSYAFSRSGGVLQKKLPAASAVNRTIDSEMGDLDQFLSRYAMRMLYTSSDVHTSIRKMLEIAGRACDVSRAYIFENSPDGQFCRNTFEWCAEGVAPQIHTLQHCDYREMADYQRNFDENGIFSCRDIRDLPDRNYRDLAAQGIVSMLQCAIRDDGRMIGFVGFDECRVNRLWTEGQARALSLVASLLGSQLVKERLKERLAQSERALSRLRRALPKTDR